jgi:hypothetical protein
MGSGSTIPGLDLAMLAQFMPKEILRVKSSVCYPPPMNAPPPSVRERPPGCRTIFVSMARSSPGMVDPDPIIAPGPGPIPWDPSILGPF